MATDAEVRRARELAEVAAAASDRMGTAAPNTALLAALASIALNLTTLAETFNSSART